MDWYIICMVQYTRPMFKLMDGHCTIYHHDIYVRFHNPICPIVIIIKILYSKIL